MISLYAKKHTLYVITMAVLLMLCTMLLGWWWFTAALALLAILILATFRDPTRSIPIARHAIVAPADGIVRSVDKLEHYPPLNGPAHRIRIFIGLHHVHINRSPCHGRVTRIEATQGKRRNTLFSHAAEDNTATLTVLHHPAHDRSIAAVRQIAGLLAGHIVHRARMNSILQRGERFGMILLGSMVELYLPDIPQVQITIGKGTRVFGGVTIVGQMMPLTQPNPPSP